MELVSALPDRFGVEVVAWCLMPTHYHVLLRSMRGQLSAAVGWLQSEYAQYFNGTRKLDGPLFRGRFGNRLVEDLPYWTHLAAYIHLNPVAARLVNHPDRARWTSHGVYLGRDKPPAWMNTTDLADSFGTLGGYVGYIRDVMTGREDQAVEDIDPPSTVAGSTARVEEGGPLRTVPLLSAEDAVRLAARVAEVPVEAIEEVSPGRSNEARWLAIWFLSRAAGLRNGELARRFETVPATITRCIDRVRKAEAESRLGQWRESLRAWLATASGREDAPKS
jgi:REP element-mobilizing transposase RayT